MTAIDTLLNGRRPDWNSPATGAAAITVSDTIADPNGPFRKLWVGATGAVKLTMLDGSIAVFPGVPVGIFEMACTMVWSTGTTVATPNTNIVGLK